MILDSFVQFPDEAAADTFMRSVGLMDQYGDIVPYSPPWNIDTIGSHSYEDGDDLIEVPGYWVMLKSDYDVEVPDSISHLLVQRDPNNPAIPNRVWA